MRCEKEDNTKTKKRHNRQRCIPLMCIFSITFLGAITIARFKTLTVVESQPWVSIFFFFFLFYTFLFDMKEHFTLSDGRYRTVGRMKKINAFFTSGIGLTFFCLCYASLSVAVSRLIFIYTMLLIVSINVLR